MRWGLAGWCQVGSTWRDALKAQASQVPKIGDCMYFALQVVKKERMDGHGHEQKKALSRSEQQKQTFVMMIFSMTG